ncbi:hypothetical protein C8R44DRAFT_877261 [Mycena epipterygia]|nr:hypothetical protein C8R44DRAFT_877261 [Mycena epipterygia]
MLRLRRIVQYLQHARQDISHYLHVKRCLLSSIRRLPPEILGIVFSFTVFPVNDAATAVSAVRLAHVCSYWRTFVLDWSKLWATILLLQPPSDYKSSVSHFDFYASHTKALPLTIRCCRTPAIALLIKLARRSHRWSDINLIIDNDSFEALDVVRRKIPLLTSLCLHNTSERDGAQTSDAFEDAPSLHRVMLTSRGGYVWPFSFVLPWAQITSLTLVPISLSVFSECIRNCSQLLYFHAGVHPRPTEVVQQMEELRSPLRKLIVQGSRCQELLIPHNFPNMVSLTLDMISLNLDFFAFLARSSRLEMLALREWDSVTTENLLALLLAAPSLRIVHFENWHTAMVTPRFYTPLVAPAPDDPFTPVAPQSLAELGVEGCAAFDDAVLRAMVQGRTERNPSFDPHGIETARLQIEGVPFDPEAEMDYILT